jgi:hypothetical protein
MLMLVVAQSHMQQNRFPYLLGYAKACDYMQPHTAAEISLLVWAMHRPDK